MKVRKNSYILLMTWLLVILTAHKGQCREYKNGEISHVQETNPLKVWEGALLEGESIQKKINSMSDLTYINEDQLLADNKILPKRGGIRVRVLQGEGWNGEIRSVTIPKNISRGESPYIIFGMIFSTENGTQKWMTFPEGKRSEEYLNLGGNWLGYTPTDTRDHPKIIKK
jgi:hypothetical protein